MQEHWGQRQTEPHKSKLRTYVGGNNPVIHENGWTIIMESGITRIGWTCLKS